ncbi:MAG: hypothetical protein V1689_04320 [Pseudomonadota bacterium]
MNFIRAVFVILLVMMIFQSCASKGESLVDRGGFSIVIVPTLSKHITVSSVDAYREGDELIISGKVKRFDSSHKTGHVDVVLCSPDGAFLAQTRGSIRDLVSKRRGESEFSFSARFEFSPPEGSRFLVKFHAGSDTDKKELKCDG